MKTRVLLVAIAFLFTVDTMCQSTENDDFDNTTGVWSMLFYTKQFRDSQFGIQGDFQDRNW